MRIFDRSANENYFKFDYDEIERCFNILGENREVIKEIIPKLELDAEHNPRNFEMKILYNERDDCTEESIFQVYVGNQRIGWVFPIQAIHSKEHSYVEDKYFLKYAYVAWSLLLERLDIEIDSINEFDLFQQYNENINILILDKDNCKLVEDFEFDQYIVGLYQKGYSVTGKGNLYAEAVDKDVRLHIQRQSKALDDIPYLIELFKKQIPRETNDISRFYLYYQVIEILISKVFDMEFSKFVDELRTTTEKLFDKKEDLGQISNEKWRVRKLCNNYCSLDTYLKEYLNEKCKDILDYTNCKSYTNMEDNLYQVRCLMVHRMYILDEVAEQKLTSLNNAFLDVIIQLVLSYKLN